MEGAVIYIWLFLVIVVVGLISMQLGEIVVELRLIRRTMEDVRDFMRRGQ